MALQAAAADIEFWSGRFQVVGTDREIGILDLAAWVKGGAELPPDVFRKIWMRRGRWMPRRLPSRTAAMWRRWKSIRKPA